MGNLTHEGIKSLARVTWLHKEEFCQGAETFIQAVKVMFLSLSHLQAHMVYPGGSPGFCGVISPPTGFLILQSTMILGFTPTPQTRNPQHRNTCKSCLVPSWHYPAHNCHNATCSGSGPRSWANDEPCLPLSTPGHQQHYS